MSTDRTDLEAKVAFLERTVDGLNVALQEHAQILSALEKRVARLEKKSESGSSDPDVGPHDSPPPHY